VFAIALVSAFSLLALVIDLATLASPTSFGALVAFSAVNLAMVKTYLVDDGAQRNLKGLLCAGLVPLGGWALTLWLWASLSALTLVIGLCGCALRLAYLAVLTVGFRRPVRLVDFTETA